MARALGTDDSITTCDCCGRSDLKFTVTIELDDGELVHYGQVCAGRNTGKTRPVINAEIKAHEAAQLAAARAEFYAHPAHAAERARFAERDALPWDHECRRGIKAAEFVREASNAAQAARASIAARFNVSAWSL